MENPEKSVSIGCYDLLLRTALLKQYVKQLHVRSSHVLDPKERDYLYTALSNMVDLVRYANVIGLFLENLKEIYSPERELANLLA